MDGVFLRLYVEEQQTHNGVLLWEWLLERANATGLRGGSAFRAIGGFGRHREIHESRFFELAGDTGVEVEFIASDQEVDQYLALIRREGIRVFYVCIPAKFDILNP